MTSKTTPPFPTRIKRDLLSPPSEKTKPPKPWMCTECRRQFTGWLMIYGNLGWDYGDRKGPFCDECSDWLVLGGQAQEFVQKHGPLSDEQLSSLRGLVQDGKP